MKQMLAGQMAAMKEYFDRSTRALEEADSGFAPQAGLFTTAQVVAHVAQTVEWFLDGAFAATGFSLDFEKMDAEVRAVTSLTAAHAWFEKACATVQASIAAHSEEEWLAALPPGPIMGGLPRVAIFNALTDHTAHHRGALTVYTRLLNKVPPMPYMDM
ncbi:DinB family protein [uncultured Paludibaculum sp.]|uniref:DinB family protein n=1 Tax=uncultured Paludibaculum sp. TaxID=1765020 RepID=UPI002AAAEB79|nr:DinB family protein [uncultured Paludibaculum sp.]